MAIHDCAPDCEERASCEQAGTENHISCGFCEIHQTAQHHCNCAIRQFAAAYSGL